MKLNLKKRDLLFFVLGAFAILLIEFVIDWDRNVQAFQDGYNGKPFQSEQTQE
ncbi:hypothetical protein [Mangrovibacterium diazotrophicum]|uniref:Uncharacterized protein n=1 Tax=Mangrovibacterium diazotrophicum TaxID=1261403 RepID=A0A419VV35_9BACT|nr:hypothetical protein [Mangrovibacterium diazotrophicum]RKD85998.1 hypothetical protein BC643_4314 [Mangrovibacterium diazotrophicum]